MIKTDLKTNDDITNIVGSCKAPAEDKKDHVVKVNNVTKNQTID